MNEMGIYHEISHSFLFDTIIAFLKQLKIIQTRKDSEKVAHTLQQSILYFVISHILF